MKPRIISGPRILLASLALSLAACSDCKNEEEAPPVVPESAQEGSGFDPFGNAQAAVEVEAVPERPAIVHDEPPTAEDFAVSLIEGPWSTFRGAGHRSGLRDVRSIRAPNILWSIQVGVQGYPNSPIVTPEAIYVGSQGQRHNQDDEGDGIYAIDPETGAIIWHVETTHDGGGMALHEDMLVVGTDGREIIGINRHTGIKQWTVAQDCQIYHAPALHNGYAYVIRTDEAAYMRINIETGAVEGELECWRSERGALSVDETRVYRAANRGARAYDDLGLAWAGEADAENQPRGRWTPPQVTESMTIEAVHRWPFEAANGGVNYRPAAVARWQDNGQVVWAIDVNDLTHANTEPEVRDSPFLRNMPLVMGDRLLWTPNNAGTVVAYDLLTGEREEAVPFPDCRNRQFGSMVGTSDMAYYPRHDGVLYGISPEPLAVEWSLSLGLHGAVGTRTDTHFPVQGSCSSEPDDGSALFATPAIGEDGRVYVGSGDGWLYAIGDENWE